MLSPCKDCQRRTVGCHNVDTCPEWREYVENKKKENALKQDTIREGNDLVQHLRRHGYKLPRK